MYGSSIYDGEWCDRRHNQKYYLKLLMSISKNYYFHLQAVYTLKTLKILTKFADLKKDKFYFEHICCSYTILKHNFISKLLEKCFVLISGFSMFE